MVAVSLARLSIFADVVLIGLPIWTFLRNLTRASLLVMVGSSPIRELTSLLFKTGLFMCSACCGNLLILLLDGLACCLACCFVLLAFRRPLVFICSLHSLPGVRWFHSCLWWLGCLERGFVRASGGWLRVVVGSVCFSPFLVWGGCGFRGSFWAAASLLRSAAGAVFCSPALMRCLLGGSSWIK